MDRTYVEKAKAKYSKRGYAVEPTGRERDRKRPREAWQRSVERDRRLLGLGWGELSRVAQDRDAWRALISGLYPDQG